MLEKLAADTGTDAEPDAVRAWRGQMAYWQRGRPARGSTP
jgi:hypothetical protein